MSRYGLGYLQLNRKEQDFYSRMEELLHKHETKFIIPSGIDVIKVLDVVLGDNPDIIHILCPEVRTSGFSGKSTIVGGIEKKQSERMEEELCRRTEEIVWELDKKIRNDRDIFTMASEYIQKNVRYDDSVMREGSAVHPEAYSAYGAIVENLAVCDGISKAYSLLLSYFGIRSMRVNGRGKGKFSGEAMHAWNLVEFEKEFYHCDVTWDLCNFRDSGIYSYQFLGLNDSEISIDHLWDLKSTPESRGKNLSYYRYNKLYANSEAQITEIIRRQFLLGREIIRVRIDEKIPFRGESISFLKTKIREALGPHGFRLLWNEEARTLAVTVDSDKE